MFHYTQVGYIPGMQEWLHMHIVLYDSHKLFK